MPANGFGGALVAGEVRDAVSGLLVALPLTVVVMAMVGVITVHNSRVPRRLR